VIQFICRLIVIFFMAAMIGVLIYGAFHGLGGAK